VTEGCQPSPEHLPAGVYRHYKGGLYLIIGLAFDANIEGRTAVAYVPLYTREDQPGPRLTVRTAEDFFADLDPHTGLLWAEHEEFIQAEGQDCGCSGPIKRFTYLGPTYDGQPT
jgi:hypothetical protein